MAQDIKVLLGVSVTKDGVSLLSVPNKRTNLEMTGKHCIKLRQTIGTVAEPLNLGSDIAIPGFGTFENLDDTPHNTIEVGTMEGSVFVPFCELHFGDPANFISIFTLDLYARAASAPADLLFSVFER